MNDLLRDSVMYFLNLLDVRLLHGLTNSKLILPYYHLVSDSYLPHVSPLFEVRSIQDFRRDINFFLKNYAPISLLDISNSIFKNTKLPSRCFHLTFDDGYVEMYKNILPILSEFNLSATFFITTSFVGNNSLFYKNKAALIIDYLLKNKKFNDSVNSVFLKENSIEDNIFMLKRCKIEHEPLLDYLSKIAEIDWFDFLRDVGPYLDKEQIGEIVSMGHTIGGHSTRHQLYCDLSTDQQISDAKECLDYLEFVCGSSITAFSFPFGDWDIKKDFFLAFERIITFGTNDMKEDFIQTNFQRFWMETSDDVKQRLKKLYIDKFLRKYIAHNDVIIRA